tara:strand:+ start:168 stop:881 length:714 start_codon:yes stop_codon:yes gene_type:complete
MSFDTHKYWVYQLVGRDIHLWQYVYAAAVDTLGSYKIRLPGEYYGKQLVYPDEDITNGLRIEYTALIEPFVGDAWEDLTARASGTTISFNDDGDSASGYNDIYDTGDGLTDFESGDRIRVIGSASNDGDYTLTADAGGARYIQVGTGNLTDEAAGESVTIYQIPKEDTSPDESNHVNLNRMLSLAVVDYVKAQLADKVGEVQKKEYYMKEFWKKVGDNVSNKRKISMTFPISPFGVR